MLSIFSFNSKTTQSSGGGGSATVYNAGIQKIATLVKNNSFSIPSGAYKVEVLNNDLTENITINGSLLGPQLRQNYIALVDEVAQKMDFVPQLIIDNPNSIEVIISVIYPSNSQVNPITI